MDLAEYVLNHTVRGECQCGKCIDKGDAADPDGHTVDTGFFKVAAANDPKKEDFEKLVREHKGVFNQLDMFNGVYSFIEVGGFVGDQGLAMLMMALGSLLGSWKMVSREGEGCITVGLTS